MQLSAKLCLSKVCSTVFKNSRFRDITQDEEFALFTEHGFQGHERLSPFNSILVELCVTLASFACCKSGAYSSRRFFVACNP